MTSGSGTCTVRYDQAGNGNYNAADRVTESVAAQKPGQTITVTTHAPSSATYGTSFVVAATGGASGNPVVFSSGGACSNSASLFTMTSGTGICIVKYDQVGDAGYSPAAQVIESVTAQKANQTITVTSHAPGTAVYGSSFGIAANAPGGVVSFSSGGSCSNSGSTFTMTSGSGTCTVRYDQVGDGNYNAASQVSEFVAAQKAGQTITFGTLAAKREHDADFTVNASASSGLAVSFAASGNCMVSGATVHLTGSGSCTLNASQAGDASYNAAPTVTQTFTIQAAQTPPRTCRVPKVVGKPVATAKTLVKRAHCGVGTVRFAHSRRVKAGRVISQSRRPGGVLPKGWKINLVVSRGRQR